ncbi:hypothetical protein [Viridibacillus arvi]|uniref:hypothetical protein n=1 Tax=Viridibacillus arvi TaxID=263475 RepID=UPI0034CFC7C2
MNQTSTKTGVTATGFSRSSFGCCARHHLCEMGRKGCFYEDKDPEVPTLCAAYLRNAGKKEKQPKQSIFTIIDNSPTTEEKPREALQENPDGQLSLF